jgi:hypothetical protein
MYLLPATTYDGGRAGGHARNQSDFSIFPPRVSYTPEERPISFTIPFDTRSSTSSRFDTSSNSESSSEPTNLLDEIDDAIDQVFLYSVSSHTEEAEKKKGIMLSATKYVAETLPATKYQPELMLAPTKYDASAKDSTPKPKETLLPATKYEPEPKQITLPSTTYSPPRGRKDSAVPWLEKELPPVPLDGR